ncbi:hypothetical protein [Paenibacillus wynnii]|uniref:Bacteriocin n=1 Tax=Paenibacillus wynnii TaxID=268407 RepID=A0A098MFZ4_9BACL|nr:hypothetical protein [Paenibacillus wynnii]KGE20462.1 hypothetical protein PWYN_14775 [Paenibacillus wynnii]
MNTFNFHELSQDDVMLVDGGDWLDKAVAIAKSFTSTPLGKVVGVVGVAGPAYDFLKGIKAGWDSYN